MNTSKHLILVKDKDKTADIKICKYNPNTQKYDITFTNGSSYSYNYMSICWLKDPEVLQPSLVHIKYEGKNLFKIKAIYVFKGTSNYYRIYYEDNSERLYEEDDLDIVKSCLNEEDSKNCLRYLNELAVLNELRAEDGTMLLKKQYEKIDFVGSNIAMAVYLNPKKQKPNTYSNNFFVFPFGGNASQHKAVKNALNNQISVVQGPPGTGKTQTILNIIANLLVQGKTVQVVSNNNFAVMNVLEKLSSPKYSMGFLAAHLGNSSNKEEFINNQTGTYPSINNWETESKTLNNLHENIIRLEQELSDIYEKQERLAVVRQELNALELEIKYFKQYCSETSISLENTYFKRHLQSDKLIRLWQECYEFSEKVRKISFWFKIKSIFLYGISKWNIYKNSFPEIITLIQNQFYITRQSELNKEISSLINSLESVNAKQKMSDLSDLSLKYLRAILHTSYGNRSKREVFTSDDLWQRPNVFLNEYPVVLSTTFSSLSSLGKGVQYDYLIMDESSQVDIATGALALSCAINTVIVGDDKQLPNVVTDEIRMRADTLFNSYNLPKEYSFSDNSFLKSICTILPDVPQTLLREHYRCHPKIIGFCNQKFYENKLLIMTEDNKEPDTLSMCKTVVGNHERDHMNQRQIDVICKEVLPKLQQENGEDIGIIAPYNNQVNEMKKQLASDSIDIATVHKFQGREKDTIILATVDDVVTEFSDDPYLLNVAVSRAKKRLCLIVSGNEQPADSNIGDLVSYIQYNNFQVTQSEIYSVFDYLYQQYTADRIEYLKKHKNISQYDSENIMYATIVDILACYPDLSLNVICHQPLNMLIRDPKHLNDEECKYLMNSATHVDFLVYNRISKKPIFAIEVDGFHYHKEGSKQNQHDKMKDHIFEVYNIPLLRLPTTGSDEKDKIIKYLMEYKESIN